VISKVNASTIFSKQQSSVFRHHFNEFDKAHQRTHHQQTNH